MKTSSKWLIGGLILLVLIIIGVSLYFVFRKPKTPATASGTDPVTGPVLPPVVPCVPFTTGEEERAIQACRSKCGPKLTIPIVGIGSYTKCMQECKSGLPPVTTCF